MNRTALRTASARAAAKARADEEEAKKAKAEDMESSEDDETETDASEADPDEDGDDDTGGDAPNPPKKGKKATTKATATVLSPRAAERQRIQAIMGSEAAEGREELAEHLAYETDMSAKAALAMLAKAPQATVEASEPAPRADRGTFRDAMRATAQNDGRVAAGKSKGGTNKAHDDMSDDEFTASVVGFAAKYGLAKA